MRRILLIGTVVVFGVVSALPAVGQVADQSVVPESVASSFATPAQAQYPPPPKGGKGKGGKGKKCANLERRESINPGNEKNIDSKQEKLGCKDRDRD